jgi:hypothetical protein
MLKQFAALMREFGAVAGLENFTPDENNECVLGIDNFVVTLGTLTGETILIYAAVGKLGETNKDELMARLLAGNYFFAETGGATLAVSPLNNEIQLIYGVRLQGLDAQSLVTILENFLERLDYWHSYCINPATQVSASDFPPSGGIRA